MSTINYYTPNYSTYDVLNIYWQTLGTANPSPQDITQFDATLFAANDATLVQIMGAMGIPTDKSTKSTVLALSRSGAGTLGQRITAACTFFQNTHE